MFRCKQGFVAEGEEGAQRKEKKLPNKNLRAPSAPLWFSFFIPGSKVVYIF
jgi:hypothetical protein